MSELTTGGDTAELPENWVPAYGYPMNKRALWIGREPATSDDVKALNAKELTPEPDTLCGILDPEWDAPQYDRQRETIKNLEEGETVPRYGGIGSWAYQSQNLPDDIDRMLPPGKWCVCPNGAMHRMMRFLPVKRVQKAAVIEYHKLDYEVEWEPNARLWVWQK